MQPIRNAWCANIDITNHCFLSCLYCSRYNRHLRPDQRKHMSLEQFETALASLENWPNKIGIIGGEPLLHPDFPQITKMIRQKIPAERIGIFTSGGKYYKEYLPYIKRTFGFCAYNEHNQEQLKMCKHQPLTIAIKEAVPDAHLRKLLIDDCWVQRKWCPTINHFGAYFCEVAAAQDALLNEGRNAWPVVPGWWDKGPDEFSDQVAIFCDNCGMAIPMERELILNKTEKFSPGLLQLFRDKELMHVTDSDVELFKHSFSLDEIQNNIPTWTPGNYRGDLVDDSHASEGLGFTKKLSLRVELITIWYNEEFFAPFFLNHYSWVDKIHLIVDADTNDSTVALAKQHNNVEISYMKFPDMMDDDLKSQKFTSVYNSITDADYVIVVDSDEFIFCNQIDKSVKLHLLETQKDIYLVNLWQIYKHEDDLPLDSMLPVPFQRRYGDPDMEKSGNIQYVKPCLVKACKNIKFGIGNHYLYCDGIYVSAVNGDIDSMRAINVSINNHDMLQGSHWRLVDLEDTIKRRISNRKHRQSANNLKGGHSTHYHEINEYDIIKEYEDNKRNPMVIFDRSYD